MATKSPFSHQKIRQLELRLKLKLSALSYLRGVEGQQQGPTVGEKNLHGVVSELPPALVHLLDLLVGPGEGRRLRLPVKTLPQKKNKKKTKQKNKRLKQFEATSSS